MSENKSSQFPFVSIIIPCRNEEKFIGQCLDSVLGQDYPREKTEILVVDGMSEDKTKEIVIEYTKQYSFIKVLDNYKKIYHYLYRTLARTGTRSFENIYGFKGINFRRIH